jgi:hypothetical protein
MTVENLEHHRGMVELFTVKVFATEQGKFRMYVDDATDTLMEITDGQSVSIRNTWCAGVVASCVPQMIEDSEEIEKLAGGL